MPNDPLERQKFRTALKLIADKYQPWIYGNPNLLTLLGSSQEVFDQRVKFMDHGTFMTNLMLTTKPKIGCTTLGFTDYLTDPPTIFINRTHAKPSTLIHELLHFLTHPNFRDKTTSRLNEGITEYFTRKVQGHAAPEHYEDFLAPRTSYDDEWADVNSMRGFFKKVIIPGSQFARTEQPVVIGRQRTQDFMPDLLGGLSGKDFVKRAYFKGEIAMISLLKENFSL